MSYKWTLSAICNKKLWRIKSTSRNKCEDLYEGKIVVYGILSVLKESLIPKLIFRMLILFSVSVFTRAHHSCHFNEDKQMFVEIFQYILFTI